MNFLGMGPAELLLVLALALIVFGPDKLPDIARQLGRVVAEFRRVSSDVTREIQRSIEDQPPTSGPRIVRQAPPSGPPPVQPAATPFTFSAPAEADAPKPNGEPENRILPPTNGEREKPATAPVNGEPRPVPPSGGSWEDGPAPPATHNPTAAAPSDPGEEVRRPL
jgi:Tat protein translocase TatB subunit